MTENGLEWHNERRRIGDLKSFEGNPRKMSKEQADQLISSLKKFNIVEIPAINTDNTILAGNMRIQALITLKRQDEEIDVRVPNRILNENEAREYLIRSNKNIGEWDWDILANTFEIDSLVNWGFLKEELGIGIDIGYGESFTLPSGDKAPFQQMTFTLADEQAIMIQNAIADIKKTEEYKYIETMGNENSNGNALYLIVRQWVEQKKS